MKEPQIEPCTDARENGGGFSIAATLTRVMNYWRPIEHSHKQEFMEEQYHSTRGAIRAAMVVGTLVFAFRGIMDWANGMVAPVLWHEVAFRATFVLLQLTFIFSFSRRISFRKGEVVMILYAAALVAGIVGANALNIERTPYSLFPITFVCLIASALWLRGSTLAWTLSACLVPVVVWMFVSDMASLDRKTYMFYIPLAIVLGLVIRHGRLATAFDAFLLRRHLAAQALNDPLTGILNRAGWQNRLATKMKSGAPPQPSSMLFFDLDKFKAINDKHGHPVGDMVIQATADKVQSMLREKDILARFGGEEFVVFLPGLNVDKACAVAERIRQAIEDIRDPVPVTVSIGVSEFRPGETVEEAMDRADHALLEAKQQGRNRVLVAH